MNKVYLKKGKERPIMSHHHWIFSGAIDKGFDFPDGEIAKVFSYTHEFLGHAYFNRKPRTLTGRMLNFSQEDPIETLKNKIKEAIALRKELFNEKETNCFRLINGEGDGIPGLVIDQYNDVLVIQVSTLGIETLKKEIVQALVELIKPKTIFEKSNLPSRREEGMTDFQGYIYGEEKNTVIVKENNVLFSINLENSHKTGFYLDQREMRKLIGEISTGKKVLNCFSYTGGFSLYAASNDAKEVVSVDISKEVIEQAEHNFRINNLNPCNYGFMALDVFDFLSKVEKLNYDIVILDPPAFAKKKSDIENALKGYKKINREAISKMPKGSILLTCSCSYNVDHEMFKKIVGQAALSAKRDVKILSEHIHARDHVLNIFHPEMDYLKSLLLYIN